MELTVTGTDPVHPLASVTETVYVPEESPVATAFVPPDADHEYVKGICPPEIVTVADPFAERHVAEVEVAEAVKLPVTETVTVTLPVQLFASVTITVYVPPERPVATELVPPEGDHA